MAEPAKGWVSLARIRRPQGRKGEVFAEVLTDFPEKFAERRRVWLLSPQEAEIASRGPRLLRGDVSGAGEAKRPMDAPERVERGVDEAREMELVNHWAHKGGVVLHFRGVESISEAEALKGLIVAVPREERVRLGEDEFYIGDLIGCVLADVAGAEPVRVGEIEDVDRTAGPVALLKVRGARGEVLVPFAKSYLRRIDLDGKRVEMALPEGLVELNAG